MLQNLRGPLSSSFNLIFHVKLFFLLNVIKTNSRWTNWTTYSLQALHFRFLCCIQLSPCNFYFVVSRTSSLSRQETHTLAWDISDQAAETSNLYWNSHLSSSFQLNCVIRQRYLPGPSTSLSFLVHPLIMNMVCFMRISNRSSLADIRRHEYTSSILKKSKHTPKEEQALSKQQSKCQAISH